MTGTGHKVTALHLPRLGHVVQTTVADQVFEMLHRRILCLDLPPLTKLSEAEVAALMGVSRQPVREAFKRLAKLGFLVIRPQSSTTVSLISEEAVVRAHYIRAALEIQNCKTACVTLTADGDAALLALIDQQRAAVATHDKEKFHALDDAFHREICVQSGIGYVWDLILENKGHMDRVRMISLDTLSQKMALEEHIAIYEALRSRQPEQAVKAIEHHLARIFVHIETVKAQKHDWFVHQQD
ncbi:GntR family transcriptional regulator [uncultured Sulfitobacter sp.]|uniref:GntR family transcriptional regulator n=1 Tax=uncultured Sulfitobacter sp. TaxID=191468 RepID=UPI0030DA3FD4